MHAITTVGLVIGKSLVQAQCVDAQGSAVVRQQLKRRYVLTLVEALRPLPRCYRGVRNAVSYPTTTRRWE
jgi:hypothetical protein